MNAPEPMNFSSPNQKGFAVKFSPFSAQFLAYTASENFGIKGNGYLYILEVTPAGLRASTVLQWPDCLFDVTWSEQEPDVLLSCSGDALIQLWKLAPGLQTPLSIFKEHKKEVYSLDWNQARQPSFLSASWDGTAKLWDVQRPASISTFCGHNNVVNDISWSPTNHNCFASVGADAVLRIWNVDGFRKDALSVPTGTAEVLSCDWCKYNPNIIATASTDASIHGWDLRNATEPLFVLRGHNYAVKCIKFSPYHENIVASCSYDFTTRIWDTKNAPSATAFNCKVFQHHTEFVYGLDFNIHVPNQLADCSWDEHVELFDIQR